MEVDWAVRRRTGLCGGGLGCAEAYWAVRRWTGEHLNLTVTCMLATYMGHDRKGRHQHYDIATGFMRECDPHIWNQYVAEAINRNRNVIDTRLIKARGAQTVGLAPTRRERVREAGCEYINTCYLQGRTCGAQIVGSGTNDLHQ